MRRRLVIGLWSAAIFVGVLLVLSSTARAAVPSRVVYQGRLSKSGVAQAGRHTFAVRLVRADGSSVAGYGENFTVTLPASGDFALALTMPDTIDWAGENPRLELTVDGEKMSPTEPFAAAPYSFLALKSSTVVDGSIIAASLADDAVTTAKIRDGAVTSAKILDGTVGAADLAAGSVTDAKIATVSSAKVLLRNSSTTLESWSTPDGWINANVIVGTVTATSSHQSAHIDGGTDALVGLQPAQISGTAMIQSANATQTIQPTQPTATPLIIKPLTGADPSGVNILELQKPNASPAMTVTGTGNVGIGTTSPGNLLSVTGGASVGSSYTATAAPTNGMIVQGNVGIGTTAPVAALSVEREVLIHGNNSGGTEYRDWPVSSLAIRRSDDYVVNGVTMMSFGYRNDPLSFTDNSVANIRLYDPSQSPNAPTSAATTQLRIAAPGPVVLQPSGGNVGIGTTSPAAKLEVAGRIRDASGFVSPVGSMIMFGGSAAPTGWLLCDGTAVSRTTYAELFAVIGTTFGNGDGGSTFNLPDMRGVFPKGAGTTHRAAGKDANGNFYSGTLGTYATDQLQGHIHKDAGHNHINGFAGVNGSSSYGVAESAPSGNINLQNGQSTSFHDYTSTSASNIAGPVTDGTNGPPRTGSTTEPQSLGVNHIIKY